MQSWFILHITNTEAIITKDFPKLDVMVSQTFCYCHVYNQALMVYPSLFLDMLLWQRV